MLEVLSGKMMRSKRGIFGCGESLIKASDKFLLEL